MKEKMTNVVRRTGVTEKVKIHVVPTSDCSLILQNYSLFIQIVLMIVCSVPQ